MTGLKDRRPSVPGVRAYGPLEPPICMCPRGQSTRFFGSRTEYKIIWRVRTRISRRPPKKDSAAPASVNCFAWKRGRLYIFPYKIFLIISLAVILTVWYRVGTSKVDVRASANPNGNMSGIQPIGVGYQYKCTSGQKGYNLPTAYSSAKQPRCILYCLTSPRRR